MHLKNISGHTQNVIIIAGPTASGKTAVAIEVALRLGTEIISADSRQCYRELNIGVARPSPHELEKVPHHFIASHSIHEKITAATFEQYALQKTEGLFRQNNTVVLVGGTGLYLRAFCEGFDELPDVPESIREEVVSAYRLQGLSWLQEEVKKVDPAFYEAGEIQNPQRLLRALEIVRATGRSILDFRKGRKKERPFGIIKLALDLPKEELHQNINTRVDRMMEAGLLEEVRPLIPYQYLNALQTVGYRELFDFFNGQLSLPAAVAAIKQNTRQYAKRQLTWFRKDPDIRWVRPEAVLAALGLDDAGV